MRRNRPGKPLGQGRWGRVECHRIRRPGPELVRFGLLQLEQRQGPMPGHAPQLARQERDHVRSGCGFRRYDDGKRYAHDRRRQDCDRKSASFSGATCFATGSRACMSRERPFGPLRAIAAAWPVCAEKTPAGSRLRSESTWHLQRKASGVTWTGRGKHNGAPRAAQAHPGGVDKPFREAGRVAGRLSLLAASVVPVVAEHDGPVDS